MSDAKPKLVSPVSPEPPQLFKDCGHHTWENQVCRTCGWNGFRFIEREAQPVSAKPEPRLTEIRKLLREYLDKAPVSSAALSVRHLVGKALVIVEDWEASQSLSAKTPGQPDLMLAVQMLIGTDYEDDAQLGRWFKMHVPAVRKAWQEARAQQDKTP